MWPYFLMIVIAVVVAFILLYPRRPGVVVRRRAFEPPMPISRPVRRDVINSARAGRGLRALTPSEHQRGVNQSQNSNMGIADFLLMSYILEPHNDSGHATGFSGTTGGEDCSHTMGYLTTDQGLPMDLTTREAPSFTHTYTPGNTSTTTAAPVSNDVVTSTPSVPDSSPAPSFDSNGGDFSGGNV